MFYGFHECSRAVLHVVEQMSRAGGDFLGDDGGADKRQRVYRACRVAEGVDLLVRRREIPCLDYGEPYFLDLVPELLLGEVAREAGDRLQFVNRAARRAEAPPRELGYGCPAS